MKEYKPKTRLGKKLISLRNKAVKKGMKFKTVDEILELIRRNRCR